jgi:GNAT superfamily N-acetyltransferase
MNFESEGFSISTDKTKLDLEMICKFLSSAYWASNRSTETILKSLEHSLCFGLYHHQKQIGLARVITDHATFAYLCDVFVLKEFQGRGLGKFLMQTVLEYPDLSQLRRFMLATKDAHRLYSQVGFTGLVAPDRWMERFNKTA